MIPAIERAKTVHALDRAATVIGGTFPKHLISNNNMEGAQTCEVGPTLALHNTES
jgi:hypothetical protein